MKSIEQLVEDELRLAQARFSPFNSSHEGWAVIKEEFEELKEMVVELEGDLNKLWQGVRRDDYGSQQAAVTAMSNKTLKTIKEAVQVAAMVRRFISDCHQTKR